MGVIHCDDTHCDNTHCVMIFQVCDNITPDSESVMQGLTYLKYTQNQAQLLSIKFKILDH